MAVFALMRHSARRKTDLFWHLGLRHLVLWEILSSESRTINAGGEGIGLAAGADAELLHARDERGIDVFVLRDLC